jgi:fumarate hydratase class I
MKLEQGPAAKDAIAQILTNSRMCAEGHRPICQDTGIVVAFVKVGMKVRWDASSPAGHGRRGRAPRLSAPGQQAARLDRRGPGFRAQNTRDNTPAVMCTSRWCRATGQRSVAAKGGGSENKSKFVMLNPSDSSSTGCEDRAALMGAGWCPPGMLGIGIGGTAEKAMLMAKEALMEPIDMAELKARGRARHRGAAHRAARQGQRARHRRPGPRRALDRARRQDHGLPDTHAASKPSR